MKRVLSSIVSILILITSINLIPTYACDTINFLTYSYNTVMHTATVSDCSSIATTVNIPSVIQYQGENYTVTTIGYKAFENCSSLTKVTIPDTVTSIENSAFFGSYNLESINIPDSVVNIENSAFYNTAYYNNKNNWQNNVLYIDNALIKALPSLSGSFIIKEGCTLIAAAAFSNCSSITDITIPETLISICDSAFVYCSSLENINIPNSVIYIGNSAFDNTKYYNNKNNWQNNVLYIDNALIKALPSLSGTYIIKEGCTLIAKKAFLKCNSLLNIQLSDSVTTIGEYAFSECDSLQSAYLGKSLININDYTFNNCLNLTTVTMHDSVTYIGDYAFSGCSKLSEISLSNTVKIIGAEAFGGCVSLTKITIPSSVKAIGNAAFNKCISLTTIDVNATNQSYSSENGVLFNKDKTKLITYPAKKSGEYIIPDTVKSIGYNAFHNCYYLTNIIIPDSVTIIEENAFKNCLYLQDVIIPNSVTTIGISAFYNCSTFKNIFLPDSVTYIGSRAFSACSNLTNVTLSNSLVVLESNAFYQCKSLTSVVMPKSITTIKMSAFDSCPSLKYIFYTSNKQDKELININSYNDPVKNATWYYNVFVDNTHVFLDYRDTTCEVCNHVRSIDIPEISVVSMTLYNSIAYNVKITGDIKNTNATVTFTLANKTYTVTNYTSENKYYIFTLESISPQYMTENITVTLDIIINDQTITVDSYETTLKDYCNSVAANNSDYKDLVTAVLNYGAAAQQYKSYKTDELANKSLSESEKTVPAGNYFNAIDKEYFTIENDLALWKSYGLILDDKAVIKLSFESDQDIRNLSVKVETEFMEEVAVLENCFKKEGNKYTFYFDDFSIAELDEIYLFTVYKDGVPVSDTLSYSVESYASKAVITNDSLLVNLIHTLMNYANIAKNY